MLVRLAQCLENSTNFTNLFFFNSVFTELSSGKCGGSFQF